MPERHEKTWAEVCKRSAAIERGEGSAASKVTALILGGATAFLWAAIIAKAATWFIGL